MRPGSPTIWKRMLEARATTEPRISWLVGRGDIDAYKDRWCDQGNIIQSNPLLKLHSCFNPNGLPSKDKFISLLSTEALEEAKNKNIPLSKCENRCIWDLTYLSLSSACDLIRKRGFHYSNLRKLLAQTFTHKRFQSFYGSFSTMLFLLTWR